MLLMVSTVPSASVKVVAGGTTTKEVMNAPPATPVARHSLAIDAGGELVLVVEDPRELGADGRLSGEPVGVVQGRGGVAEELAVELVAVDVVDPRSIFVPVLGLTGWGCKAVVIGRQLAAGAR